MSDLDLAVGEALAYNRMGALDKSVLEDISYDHGVSAKDILKKIGWDSIYDCHTKETINVEDM